MVDGGVQEGTWRGGRTPIGGHMDRANSHRRSHGEGANSQRRQMERGELPSEVTWKGGRTPNGGKWRGANSHRRSQQIAYNPSSLQNLLLRILFLFDHSNEKKKNVKTNQSKTRFFPCPVAVRCKNRSRVFGLLQMSKGEGEGSVWRTLTTGYDRNEVCGRREGRMKGLELIKTSDITGFRYE
ncbi:hypothetical protein Btru_005124 [Bulinus truncatus]|nr:hypothetical protein Btru_005124 [Bulinus truncatus]